MKTPRDVDWNELVQALSRFGYQVVRQTGATMNGEHHLTIPAHRPLRIGTLNQIVGMAASHFGMTRGVMMDELFGK